VCVYALIVLTTTYSANATALARADPTRTTSAITTNTAADAVRAPVTSVFTTKHGDVDDDDLKCSAIEAECEYSHVARDRDHHAQTRSY
jgi:hypothetical protein